MNHNSTILSIMVGKNGNTYPTLYHFVGTMKQVLVALMLLIGFAHAGTVKTFDGIKVSKDSTAELKLFFEIFNRIPREVVTAHVISIDTIKVCDKLLSGRKYSYSPYRTYDTTFYRLAVDNDAALRLNKARLHCRRYTIMAQCMKFDRKVKTNKYDYSSAITFEFLPEPGRSYQIGADLVGDTWKIWIEDAKSHEIVAQAVPPVK